MNVPDEVTNIEILFIDIITEASESRIMAVRFSMGGFYH